MLEGVSAASEESLADLSQIFNRRMAQLFDDPSWIKLYRTVDTSNGFIGFDGLLSLARDELRLNASEVSDEHLRSLWVAYDTNLTGQLPCPSFGAFMRKGSHVLADPRSWRERLEGEKKKVADERRQARDELYKRDLSRANAAGALPPASEDDIAALSRLCNAKLDELYAGMNGGQSHSQATWFSLFKQTDANDSGLICFEEWSTLVRQELGVSDSAFPPRALQSVWVALDTDGSGFINAGEWAAFMRKGELHDGTHDRRMHVAMVRQAQAAQVRALDEALRQRKHEGEAEYRERKRDSVRARRVGDRERLQKVQQEATEKAKQNRDLVRSRTNMLDLRKSLQSAPKATDDQVVALAEACNAKLISMGEDEYKNDWAPWFRLFKTIDTDGSGQISFKEFVSLVRDTLGLGAPTAAQRGPAETSSAAADLLAPALGGDGEASGRVLFSTDDIKAVWVALDLDGSGHISCGEFGAFMRKGANVLTNRQGQTGKEKMAKRAEAAKAAREAEREILYHGRSLAELESATAASEEDVRRLSEHFNARVAEMKEMKEMGGADTLAREASDLSAGQLYALFKTVDVNDNGFISFGEFRELCRDVLSLPKDNVQDGVLRAVWKALDKSGSGLLPCGDFLQFMKLGAAREKPPSLQERRRLLGERERKAYEENARQLKQAQLEEMETHTKAYERRAKALEAQLVAMRANLRTPTSRSGAARAADADVGMEAMNMAYGGVRRRMAKPSGRSGRRGKEGLVSAYSMPQLPMAGGRTRILQPAPAMQPPLSTQHTSLPMIASPSSGNLIQ